MTINHLNAIGFYIESEIDFQQLIEKMTQEPAITFNTEGGKYVRVWDESSGVELWFYVDKFQNILGLNPHYHGVAKRKSNIINKITIQDSQFEGLFDCWAIPITPEDNEYPYTFNAPDLNLNELKMGSNYDVQLVGFPHEIQCFDDEKEYDESQTTEFKYAPRSFVPIGQFNDSEEVDTMLNEPLGLLTGTILKIENKVNKYTSLPFLVILVDTLCGEIEIVTLTEWLNKEPKVGGILSGTFWLSGKIWGGK